MPSELNYEELMRQANQAIDSKDYATANKLLLQAHGAGHSNKSNHLRAHRALIRLGVRTRNPLQVASQSCLLALAWVFERN
jgi:Protein of unknown function (DUF3703)